MEDGPPTKRRRLELLSSSTKETDNQEPFCTEVPASPTILTSLETGDTIGNRSSLLKQPISPPPSKKRLGKENISLSSAHGISATIVPSPLQLSHVEGLSSSNNVNTLRLKDLIGDPLVKECWVFNFLFDIDFLMGNFDEDRRDDVKVKIVHGSWKKEDPNKLHIDKAVGQLKNVQAITAYMPEMYGTHHSKMIILTRHDDQAQVIILTANMLPRDWKMAQAVWRSPLLPLMGSSNGEEEHGDGQDLPPLGSGERFKVDLLAYLDTYGKSKLGALVDQLKACDFGPIRAALVASTPGKQNIRQINSRRDTLWGWPGLRNVLRQIPASSAKQAHVVIQVSSVASLGASDKWFKSTFLETLGTVKSNSISGAPRPKFSLVFPTADEIRRSVDGYGSGGSIHIKTQTNTQRKQMDYLKPLLCHWAGDTSDQGTAASTVRNIVREAGRRRAAPHIKTYLRFADSAMEKIDWAMTTSANLSTQAWGAAPNTTGEVRICSYEIGVVVWPGLWETAGIKCEMVPVLKKDVVDDHDDYQLTQAENKSAPDPVTRVCIRMPYDLPLVPYSKSEMPWCASASDPKLDWMGRAWPGYGVV
ncbi:MAG: hypothetical protein MMC33_003193 [Icmadophila ericetorum]|nr:hypothetical protein [Icmadophila ericetorum]